MAMLNSASVNQTVASVRNGALLGSARCQPAPASGAAGQRVLAATSQGDQSGQPWAWQAQRFGRVGTHATKYARRAPLLGQARGWTWAMGAQVALPHIG